MEVVAVLCMHSDPRCLAGLPNTVMCFELAGGGGVGLGVGRVVVGGEGGLARGCGRGAGRGGKVVVGVVLCGLVLLGARVLVAPDPPYFLDVLGATPLGLSVVVVGGPLHARVTASCVSAIATVATSPSIEQTYTPYFW